MKQGFTIVELAVVIFVIALLSGLAVTGFLAYDKRATDGQARAMAAAVQAGAERYHTRNNEYPLGDALYNGTPNGSPPTNFQTAATLLNVSTNVLNASRVKLVPCSGTGCTLTNTAHVYYLTKTSADSTTQRAYTFSGCTYTLSNGEASGLSYIIAYYSRELSAWQVTRSAKGLASTSDPTTCPFKGL